MKRLACLCALLFAGHAMAAGTCSNATFSGTYLAVSENGTLAAGVNVFAEALATADGNGTATANLNYTESGGLLNGNTNETVTYTIGSDCSLSATATLAGIPVTVKGHISPDGSKVTLVAYGLAAAINGSATRVN